MPPLHWGHLLLVQCITQVSIEEHLRRWITCHRCSGAGVIEMHHEPSSAHQPLETSAPDTCTIWTLKTWWVHQVFACTAPAATAPRYSTREQHTNFTFTWQAIWPVFTMESKWHGFKVPRHIFTLRFELGTFFQLRQCSVVQAMARAGQADLWAAKQLLLTSSIWNQRNPLLILVVA